MTLQTLKRAITELAGDEVAEPRARLETWWAFNAQYKNKDEIPADEMEYYRANMQWLVDFYTPRATRFSHLIFELNRLLGNKDVCGQMIESLTYDEYIRQRKIYFKDNKIIFYDDEENFKRRYEKEMKELKYALLQPLRPYIKNKVDSFNE